MKKKILSLLLSVAIVVTTVSIGFSGIVASALGAEAIATFRLVDTKAEDALGAAIGANYTTTIKVKNTVSGYKVVVRSITATLPNLNKTASVKYAGQEVTNANIGVTSEWLFDVSGTLSQGQADIIRYTCNYDIYTTAGVLVYSDLTGYGYGFASYGDRQTGAVGTYPGTNADDSFKEYDGDHHITSMETLNTCYVNAFDANRILSMKTNYTHGSKSVSAPTVTAGSLPSTARVFSWSWGGSGATYYWTGSSTWWTMTEPTSGYWSFTLHGPNGGDMSSQIYYMVSSDKTNAVNALNSSLAFCKQKKYYTEASWNAYLAKLDAAALAGRAVAAPTDVYKTACLTVAAAPSNLQSAYTALAEGLADYTAFNNAVAAFNAKANLTTPVTTYNPSGETGSTTMYVYDQSTVAATNSYIGECDLNLLASQQDQVDGYTAQIITRTNALSYNVADYTHLNAAISDCYANYNAAAFTSATWSNYTSSVLSAQQIVTGMTANNQSIINAGVSQVTAARMALVYVPANTAELLAQIAVAEQIIQEQPQGVPDTTWNEFQAAYSAATLLSNANVTQQTQVDSAATRLKNANLALAEYRAIDVTELQKYVSEFQKYLDINNGIPGSETPDYNYVPMYAQDKYTTGSFGILLAAIAEGNAFIEAYNLGQKNYSHYDEMQGIITHIQTGINGLVKNPADYTQLYTTLDSVPEDDVLALYIDSVVDNINTIIANINYGYKFDEQSEVNAINTNLQNALAQLVYDNYKNADYTGVDAAIAKANALNPSYYENFEIVTVAINAVDRTKKIIEQDEVDAMAQAILDAIAAAALTEKDADYTAVDAAKARLDHLEYPSTYYYNYSDVQAAIDAVVDDQKISQQAEVDAMAERINTAIDNLGLADADYTPVENAIGSIANLGNLDDYTEASLNALDDAVADAATVYNYKINDQQIVNDMAQAILDQIAAMVLLPANFSNLIIAIGRANAITRDNYIDFSHVSDAVTEAQAILNKRNIRQQAEVDAATKKINDKIDLLELKPANYTALNTVVTDTQNLLNNTLYPYTDESKTAVLNAIASIDYTKKITQQADVNAMLTNLEDKVSKLKYILASYTALNEALRIAGEKIAQKDLYTTETMDVLEEAIKNVDTTITIDQQSVVDAKASSINAAITGLKYASADYTYVTRYIETFNGLVEEYFEESSYAPIKAAVDKVVWGITKERQAEVDQMASDIYEALIKRVMKPASFTALDDAIGAAYRTIDSMTEAEFDETTFNTLMALIDNSDTYYDMYIDQQSEVDEYAQTIVAATANLKYKFTIVEGTTAIINDDDNVIYGFAEGTTAAQVLLSYFKYIGNGSIVVKDEPFGNGFGTGSVIQFLNGSGEIIKQYTVIIFGDVNGDGYVDLFDAGYVVSAANMEVELSDAILQAADINKDHVIDAYDVTSMISLANMETTISQTGDNVVTPLN